MYTNTSGHGNRRPLRLAITIALLVSLSPLNLSAEEATSSVPVAPEPGIEVALPALTTDVGSSSLESVVIDQGGISEPPVTEPILFEASLFAGPPAVPGTVLSKSADEAWDESLWNVNFAYNIELQRGMVEEGIITHVVMPLGYYFDAPDFPIYFQLRDEVSNLYDCRTPEKTMAEWGIYNNARGQHWNTVTIGPFEGTGCDTRLRTPPHRGGIIGLKVFSTTGHNAGGNLGTPGFFGSEDIRIPYVMYSSDEPSACSENCHSSVIFLPGIKGSALKEGDDSIWPASFGGEDIERLALGSDGESINDVKVAGVLGDFFGTDVYGGFASYMDDLVTDGTLAEWYPMAYDWRFSPEKILADGIETTAGHIDLVETFEGLAERSPTGKVTIVAHSMGGLMGKALIQALVDEGKADLIDSFVMVGTPQLGTPQGAASLLHGDDEGILNGLIVDATDVRQIAQNMESAYNLLPSERYLETVGDPVITFNEGSAFTASWRARWGESLDSYAEYEEFLTGTGVSRPDPSPANLAVPEILDSSILNNVEASHALYDDYAFPDSIRVVQVAGWGLPSVKTIEYKTKHLIFDGYEVHPTLEGDKTVLYPSALSSDTDETFFFDLSLYNRLEGVGNYEHRNLLSSQPIQQVLEAVFNSETIITNQYIIDERPDVSEIDPQLYITTKSPVLIGAHDSSGNFTGLDGTQEHSSGLIPIRQEIPGSSFFAAGGDQYLFLPKEGKYTFTIKGTGVGPATVETNSFVNDEVTPIAAYSEIPVTQSTKASFVLDSEAPADARMEMDQNGDGQVDGYVAPDGKPLSVRELMTNLRSTVNALSIKEKQKTQLLNRVTAIETKLNKQKQKQSNILSKLQVQITKKAGKGKIDAASAEAISSLLDELLANSAAVPIEPELIQALKDKILAATIPVQLKAGLLVKIARLENLSAVTRSLATMSQAVERKGTRGILSDAEVQNLLNLLDKLQAAI